MFLPILHGALHVASAFPQLKLPSLDGGAELAWLEGIAPPPHGTR
jgi:hypothetical protein